MVKNAERDRGLGKRHQGGSASAALAQPGHEHSFQRTSQGTPGFGTECAGGIAASISWAHGA
jgi:hypothetical protein